MFCSKNVEIVSLEFRRDNLDERKTEIYKEFELRWEKR